MQFVWCVVLCRGQHRFLGLVFWSVAMFSARRVFHRLQCGSRALRFAVDVQFCVIRWSGGWLVGWLGGRFRKTGAVPRCVYNGVRCFVSCVACFLTVSIRRG